jgi:serine/threonine protein kinase/CRP-like cAMP-binding protein
MESFGRYRLLLRIAVGGMGEIFLARSTSLDGFEKDLVLKRILPVHSANEHFVSLFLDEARLSMSLSHQNIVQVFDFGETDGRYYIAMEHVHGCDLRTLMRLQRVAGQGLPPGIALYIIREVCRGLDYAHNRRGRRGELLHLVHRDISPDNILVSLHGGVKITDFGIAKARGQISQQSEGAIVGKVHYMAPEIAAARPADRRSDVFSCGAVLWELLVGHRMYEQGEESNSSFFDRIRRGQIDRPSEHNREVPRRIEKVVMRALAVDPDDRFDSARDLGNELNELMISKYRDSDSYQLQAFLAELKPDLKIIGFDDIEETGPIAPSAPRTSPTPMPSIKSELPSAASAAPKEPPTVAQAPAGEPTPTPSEPPAQAPAALKGLEDEFKARPSVWLIVEMGDACRAALQASNAVSCYRVAAVKFAQHGLLAQSLLCAKLMLEQRGDLLAEVSTLPALVGKSNEAILPYLFRSGGEVEERLAELIATVSARKRAPDEPPVLLAHLGREGFAQLAKLAPLCRYAPEERIVVQGDKGGAMYLVLAGRVLVQVKRPSGERVNVASLQPGDFFGENSFFSGAPRNATVEAIEKACLIEIDPPLYDRVMSGNPKAASVLSRFYKERIVDRILATSSTFGILAPSERREVLVRLKLTTFDRGTELMRRGLPCEAIYLIKRGNARVSGGAQEVMNLGPGTVLGEHAAVAGGPSSVSAVAGQDFEAFVLKAADLSLLLARQPAKREAWLRAAKPDAERA